MSFGRSPGTCLRMAAAPATTARIYSQVAKESLVISSPPPRSLRVPRLRVTPSCRSALESGVLPADQLKAACVSARRSGDGALSGVLKERRSAGFDLFPDRLDPQQDLLPQVRGNLLVAAVPVHQALHDLLEAVLAQARAAFVEVDLHLGVGDLIHLAVEIAVHHLEYLATRHFMRFSAAHHASPLGASACDCRDA